MANFFEKLKKGMDVEELPEKDFSEEDLPEETPHVENTSVISPLEVMEVENKVKKEKTRKKLKKPAKKTKEIPQKKKLQIKEIKVEKTLGEKTKKTLFESEGQLVVDLYEINGEVIIQSAIAGINPEDLDINIDNDMVIIKGKREKIEEQGSINYFYQECHWGYFSREIILPVEIDAKRSEATMKNGILTIRMPKIERQGKKKLTVK